MEVSSILDSDIFKYWAEKQTGRQPSPVYHTIRSNVVIIPKRLYYRDLKVYRKPNVSQICLIMPEPDFLSFSGWKKFLIYLRNLNRLLFQAGSVDLFLVPGDDNRPLLLWTAILSRLMGRFLTLHDFRFYPGGEIRKIGGLSRLADMVIFGDYCLIPEQIDNSFKISMRWEGCSAEYESFKKKTAIPRVLVFGDYRERAVRALISNAHDLIKQKYPRTEFILINFLSDKLWPPENHQNSLRREIPADERSMAALFKEADIMLLVTPGGLNPIFISRSRAAGFPIITNGFSFPDNGPAPVLVPRDSYSTIADEIIRMVDDENYYRQCCGG